jgi:predicted nucleic acid-binding protein
MPDSAEPVFVDTSALYAVLDRDDRRHAEAAAIWGSLVEAARSLTTHSYVLVETFALVQRRLGPAAVVALQNDVVPVLDVIWVGDALHRAATEALLASGSRTVSLVDWASFAVMRDRGLRVAFAFDDDFGAQGFETLDAPKPAP